MEESKLVERIVDRHRIRESRLPEDTILNTLDALSLPTEPSEDILVFLEVLIEDAKKRMKEYSHEDQTAEEMRAFYQAIAFSASKRADFWGDFRETLKEDFDDEP